MIFNKTSLPDGTPSICACCGRHSKGIGLGKAPGDERYLCGECILLIEQIRAVKRWDIYELQARKGGMDAAACLVEEFGPSLDEWTEEQVLIFCGAIWRGCADRLHQLLRDGEAPF
ncbi:hypothetical protein [Rhizobium phage RHph_X2_25]|nr:hypothetical protein [Rhizobium phage RHph_X2_25]